jgi:hypothetical protein
VLGDGGIYASVRDLAAWDRALDDHTLVSPRLQQIAWTPARLSDGTRAPYGFGWFVDDDASGVRLSHHGETSGFNHFILKYPKRRLTVVILTNRRSGTPRTIAAAIAALRSLRPGTTASAWSRRRPIVNKLIAQCIALLVICSSALSAASAAELGLITGGEGGTYHRFGLDLKRLVKADGINLTVLPSKGSVENIFAVSQRPGVDMGIVQSDVLAFVGEQPSNAALSHIARSIRLVFPLYDEEVHVIGRQEIRSFDQLAGKRIAVGQEGSGTYLTATRLFKLSDIRPSESVPIEGPERWRS